MGNQSIKNKVNNLGRACNSDICGMSRILNFIWFTIHFRKPWDSGLYLTRALDFEIVQHNFNRCRE